MKKTYYFSHDYSAIRDENIVRLMARYSWSGYGLYWGIVEQLYLNNGYMQPDYEILSYDLRCDKDMLFDVINNFSLFVVDVSNNVFFSESVLARMELARGKSKKASENASAKWKKFYEKKPVSADAPENPAVAFKSSAGASKISAESEKTSAIKEKKRKEKKENILSTNVDNNSLGNEFLDAYVLWYEKKCGLKPMIAFKYEISALGAIKKYLENIVKKGTPLEAWNLILEKNDHWGPWEAAQIKISQINKNLPNILNNIKNGRPTIGKNRDAFFEQYLKS